VARPARTHGHVVSLTGGPSPRRVNGDGGARRPGARPGDPRGGRAAVPVSSSSGRAARVSTQWPRQVVNVVPWAPRHMPTHVLAANQNEARGNYEEREEGGFGLVSLSPILIYPKQIPL